MAGIPTPDLRALQQPLQRDQLRAARGWLREHRQAADVPGIGLAIAGWVMTLPAALILLVGLTRPGELEMVVVSSVMLAIGVGLLVWRWLRRREALRRAARLVPFAAANGFSYAQRVRMPVKASALLREGFDQLAVDVVRAPDGAEWGVWRHRSTERRGAEVLRGYLEVPWRGRRVRDLEGAPPPGLEALLRDAPLELELEDPGAGTITIVAKRPWRMTDPDLQVLVHRIRSLVADQARGPAEQLPPMPAAIASAPGSRRQTLLALGAGMLIALGAVGVALLQALVRNSV